MSARRSWDVRREPLKEAAAARPTAPRRPSLKDKRARRRKNALTALIIVLALCAVGAVAASWHPAVRIRTITVDGLHPDLVRDVARDALSGTQFLMFPRDSIFIYPEIMVRERILAAHPDIVAVSIARSGFNAIQVKSVPRASAFVWCGETTALSGTCYRADAEGLVYAQLEGQTTAMLAKGAATNTEPAAPTPPPTTELLIYAPLAQEENDDGTPIRARVVGASRIPDALRFVKAMGVLGVSIASVEIRGDEADLYTPQGTRITYILGREVEAAALAASAFPTLNVKDGSLVYVDLRFDGKVYYKRSSAVEEPLVEEEKPE